MAKVCEKCGRGAGSGASRSHSMIKTKRRFNLNLQMRTINGARMQICTDCIKTLKKSPSKP